MNIIVTGSLGYDYIMDFSGRFADRIMPDKLHVLSLSFLVDKLQKQFGGCAPNIAYTLKLLGVEPVIMTAAGNDFAPYGKFLRQHKIDTSGIRIFKSEMCSSYFVVTDKDDNQIGSFYVGASRFNHQLKISAINKKSPYDFTVISPTDPKAMIRYVQECRSLKCKYLYDPAFQIANFSAEELKAGITGAEILIGNDYEIALIEKQLAISHEELRVMVPVVITTLGSKGSVVETRRLSLHIKPAKPKNVSDPTGAGDAYRAGFLAGYLRKLPLDVCGQMGSVAAAYTVEKYGTVTHAFTKKEFIKRYEENYGSKLNW